MKNLFHLVSFCLFIGITSTASAAPSKVLKLPFNDSAIQVVQGWDYNYATTAHKGIDFKKGANGQWQTFPVTAAYDGQLACFEEGKYTGFGNVCTIKHTVQQRTFYTLYAHLASFTKTSGTVSTGDKIGDSGKTGAANGLIHLHFEVQEESLCMGPCRKDPYDILSTADKYPGGSNFVGLGPNHWWANDPPQSPSSTAIPITIASGTGATHIAVTSGLLLFTENQLGRVMKVPTSGGTPIPVAVGQSFPTGIATAGSSVYWTNLEGNSVMKAPIGGGTATVLASGQDSALGIAVMGNYVYWLNFASGIAGQGSVMRVGTDGTGFGTMFATQTAPARIVVTPSAVYWTTREGGTVPKGTLDGNAYSNLAVGQAGPVGLAVDSSNAYWTNFMGDTVMKVSLGGGVPSVIASNQIRPAAIYVDQTSVYWLNMGNSGAKDGSLMKKSLSGGAHTTLASELMEPISLAGDTQAVYWCTSDGTIMKIAK